MGECKPHLSAEASHPFIPEVSSVVILQVSGYNNDVFAYIPSRRLLAEGGYEPRRSMNYVTGTVQPGPFDPSIEERIIGKVHELLRVTAPR